MKKINLFLIAILFLFLYSCFRMDCVNRIEKEITPVDSNYKAILFSRGCGATTGTYYNVSILGKNQTIDNSNVGNIFIARRCYNIDIKWLGPNKLQVKYNAEENDVELKCIRIYSIDIEYINKWHRNR